MNIEQLLELYNSGECSIEDIDNLIEQGYLDENELLDFIEENQFLAAAKGLGAAGAIGGLGYYGYSVGAPASLGLAGAISGSLTGLAAVGAAHVAHKLYKYIKGKSEQNRPRPLQLNRPYTNEEHHALMNAGAPRSLVYHY